MSNWFSKLFCGVESPQPKYVIGEETVTPVENTKVISKEDQLKNELVQKLIDGLAVSTKIESSVDRYDVIYRWSYNNIDIKLLHHRGPYISYAREPYEDFTLTIGGEPSIDLGNGLLQMKLRNILSKQAELRRIKHLESKLHLLGR